MKKIIRIATRQSQLALWQAEHVAALIRQQHPEIEVQLVKMVSKGDKILDVPLAKVGGKGLFIKELEEGLLKGQADIAVHSMKDVPIDSQLPEGLMISTILEREDPRDAFVSNHYSSLDELPAGAIVGTSSLRRQCQVSALYPDLEIRFLRGNVNTRLAKLDAGEYDAIILASAGLIRLQFAHRIASYIDVAMSLPAIGQGAVGIELRAEDQQLRELLAPFNHEPTEIRVRAERALNEKLQGGCQVPIGGYAVIEGKELYLRALVGSPDGKTLLRQEARGPISQAQAMALQVADKLLDAGARGILDAIKLHD